MIIKKIINCRKRRFISILIDIAGAIFMYFINKNYSFINNEFYFYILNLPIWIVISYIFGRYHDFSKIRGKSIIKNFFKTFFISLIFINICFVLEKFFYINILYSFKNLSIFCFSYSAICFIFNIIFNFFINQKQINIKWLILESNKLLKYLERDNIESLDSLSQNFIFIESIDQINNNILEKIDGMIIEDPKGMDKKLVSNLKKRGILILSDLDWCENFLYRIPPNLMKEESFSDGIFYPKINIVEYKMKRIIEFFISLLLIFITSPIVILSAFLIYKEDGGPIFYSQIRRGIYGNNFRIFKLRTMKIDSEKNGIQWSSANDPRVTKIGNLLRKTRIDELPQLISVISGDMNLIGPRPERPEIDNNLEITIPYYQSRYNIRPGITGWAQVNYPYGSSIQDCYNKLSYDFFYLRNFSILLDLIILFKTVRVVLDYKNASFNS